MPTTFLGAPGATGVHGIYASDAAEGSPMPIAFFARTLKMCGTPSASGLTVRATVEHTQPATPVLPSHVVQVVPSFVEYSMM